MENSSNNNFPIEINDVESKKAEELMKYFTGEHTGFVRVGPKGYFLPHKYKQEASNIYNMEVRPTDIFITSYPRSGTTWTQELVWMVANDLDYETSNAIPLTELKKYWKYFISDLHHWTPYFEHLKESWEKRHNPNLLFLFYEELSKDLPAAVRRVADFLGKSFTKEEIDKLCEHLSIDNFKNNKSVNYDVMKELGILISDGQSFIRKGKAGGWRDYFDEEMALEADKWMEKNLSDTDLRFPHLKQ
ncbi:PREDICTED: estrogen sulfotransferase-like [Papilio polytes]|uniref:estrogen sulfotransferase-like n=1 Tax=Papilio polytes TaxID=76194 RepID=UPI000675D089|nr:PREDICTED: estrogen sulfotransferase-like [Papilio polytes]